MLRRSSGLRGNQLDAQRVRDPRHVCSQILGDSVREILLFPVIAQIGKSKHDDRSRGAAAGCAITVTDGALNVGSSATASGGSA